MATVEKRFIDMEATAKDWQRLSNAPEPRVERRQYVAAGGLNTALCSQPEVPEKNHKAKGSGNAHMLYSSDGYFMPAAACFIYNKFKAA
jgi:hypothetical protein